MDGLFERSVDKRLSCDAKLVGHTVDDSHCGRLRLQLGLCVVVGSSGVLTAHAYAPGVVHAGYMPRGLPPCATCSSSVQLPSATALGL